MIHSEEKTFGIMKEIQLRHEAKHGIELKLQLVVNMNIPGFKRSKKENDYNNLENHTQNKKIESRTRSSTMKIRRSIL